MSEAGNVHIGLIHKLFDKEISAEELLDTVPWALETAEGQMILPNLTTLQERGGA